MHYILFIPKQAVGANLVYFDLFNAAGSNSRVELKSCIPVVSGEAAVTGALGVDLFLTKTTAVGTGGTAAVQEGTSLTAATFTGINASQPINSLITARLTPTGGATAGAVFSFRSVFTEETNSGTYNQIFDMVRTQETDVPGIVLSQGQGIRVVQGSVASVGNIGFGLILKITAL